MANNIKINVAISADQAEALNKLQVIAKAATNALRDVTRDARDKGRKVISSAGFSNSFSDTLHMKFNPSSGFSTSPSAYIHTTINYEDVFETGKTIGGKPMLWLPLPSVPSIGQRLHMSPHQYVANVGPLFTIRRPGKPPMLGARIKRRQTAQPFGKFATKTQLKHGTANKIGTVETIPLYVGVPSVNIPQRFDIVSVINTALSKFDEVLGTYLPPNEDQ